MISDSVGPAGHEEEPLWRRDTSR